MRSLHFDGQYVQSVMCIAAPDELLLSYTIAAYDTSVVFMPS
jgi:hypothetical protein